MDVWCGVGGDEQQQRRQRPEVLSRRLGFSARCSDHSGAARRPNAAKFPKPRSSGSELSLRLPAGMQVEKIKCVKTFARGTRCWICIAHTLGIGKFVLRGRSDTFALFRRSSAQEAIGADRELARSGFDLITTTFGLFQMGPLWHFFLTPVLRQVKPRAPCLGTPARPSQQRGLGGDQDDSSCPPRARRQRAAGLHSRKMEWGFLPASARQRWQQQPPTHAGDAH
jgi:hypothetical protein